MNNKKRGSNFELEFAKILGKNGFWARLDKGFSQACDIIAGRNNKIYLFECKTCNKNYFNTDRIESNQSMSRQLFKVTGNDEAWIVYKVEDAGIFLSREFIKNPLNGIELGEWLINESNNI